MANPTTNFGWVMPTATDLVTDLPADFAVFGQGVDTSMQYLLGGTTGQILSKTSGTNMAFTWINNDQGDITAVTTTAPLQGGGTSGALALTVDAASTSASGVVQLSNSTSTTSSVLAATPTAVKSAYDLATTANTAAGTAQTTADAAIAKSTMTTAGDVIYRNATVPTRLGIGTAGQVLTVNSGATAPQWSTPSAGGLTLISTVVPSASSGFSFSSISGSYKHLLMTWSGILHSNNSTAFDVRLNANSGANYNSMVYYGANTTLNQANAGGATSYNPTVPVFGKNVANSGFNNTNSGYLWLYDYANTSYAKQCSGAWVFYDSSGAAHTQIWNSQMTFDILTAISSIDITRLSGTGTMTITTNGSVKLWGMA